MLETENRKNYCKQNYSEIFFTRFFQFKDQTQGSAQYRQAIYHWKALFAENLIGPIVIFLCHVTLRHSREKLQIHSLGLKMKHA